MAEASKKPNFFLRTGRRITKWFRELRSELKKVVWPTPKQLANNTAVVIACVLVVGVVIALFSIVAKEGISLLIRVAK